MVGCVDYGLILYCFKFQEHVKVNGIYAYMFCILVENVFVIEMSGKHVVVYCCNMNGRWTGLD